MRIAWARSAWSVAASLPLPGKVGLFFVVLWLLMAIFGPSGAPHPVGAVVAQDVYGAFSRAHPLKQQGGGGH